MIRLGAIVLTLILSCAGAKSNSGVDDMSNWKSEATKQMAKTWSVDPVGLTVIVHESPKVEGLTVFGVANPSGRGGWKRYAPGVVVDGRVVLDADQARGTVMKAAGLGTADADPNRLAQLVVPNQSSLGKLVTDPERGAYYEKHFGIAGVAPPTTTELDGHPAVDFWLTGSSEEPVEHYVVTLMGDGRATLGG